MEDFQSIFEKAVNVVASDVDALKANYSQMKAKDPRRQLVASQIVRVGYVYRKLSELLASSKAGQAVKDTESKMRSLVSTMENYIRVECNIDTGKYDHDFVANVYATTHLQTVYRLLFSIASKHNQTKTAQRGKK